MSETFSEQLIKKIEYAECPACGPDKIKLVDPDGRQLYCECCGRTFEILLDDKSQYVLMLGMSAEWDIIEHPCMHKWPMPPPDPNAEPQVVGHYVSGDLADRDCFLCVDPVRKATHKVGEEMPLDDPGRENRKYFESYVCCGHFRAIFGDGVFCP